MDRSSNPRDVFVTGATGYIGSRLVRELTNRGHRVRALVRAASANRLPADVTKVDGNALDAVTFAGAVRAGGRRSGRVARRAGLISQHSFRRAQVSHSYEG